VFIKRISINNYFEKLKVLKLVARQELEKEDNIYSNSYISNILNK